LVVGFNGIEKPSFVPANQWVGMKGQDVRVLYRVTLPADNYLHNLAKLPAGPVPPEHMAIVPGGVYCTPERILRRFMPAGLLVPGRDLQAEITALQLT
jgi:hypothetical protein